MTFELHPQLEKDSILLGELPLCTCRLVNNVYFPWLVLVPKIANISEIFQLDAGLQTQLMAESSWLSEALYQAFDADKINVAALGNQVPQLHIHHVVRYKDDAAWPKPIWGQASASYDEQARRKMLIKLGHALGNTQNSDGADKNTEAQGVAFSWRANV